MPNQRTTTERRRALIAAANRASSALLTVAELGDLDGAERDALSLVRFICEEMVDGFRGLVSDDTDSERNANG